MTAPDSTTAPEPDDNQELALRAAALRGHVKRLRRRIKWLTDTIERLRAERDAYVSLYGKEKEWRSAAEATLMSVQAELLAGGSLARLRAIVNLTDKETRTDA